MSTSPNIAPTPEQTPDPKTNNAGQDLVTNSEESDKVVNTDGADGSIADANGLPETLSESAPSSAGNATGGEIGAGDTATDADVAGGNPVI